MRLSNQIKQHHRVNSLLCCGLFLLAWIVGSVDGKSFFGTKTVVLSNAVAHHPSSQSRGRSAVVYDIRAGATEEVEKSDSEDSDSDEKSEDGDGDLLSVALDTAMDVSQRTAILVGKACKVSGVWISKTSIKFYKAIKRAVVAGLEGDDEEEDEVEVDEEESKWVTMSRKVLHAVKRMAKAAWEVPDEKEEDDEDDEDARVIKSAPSFFSKFKLKKIVDDDDDDEGDDDEGDDDDDDEEVVVRKAEVIEEEEDNVVETPLVATEPKISKKKTAAGKPVEIVESSSIDQKAEATRTSIVKKGGANILKKNGMNVVAMITDRPLWSGLAVTFSSVLVWENSRAAILPKLVAAIASTLHQKSKKKNPAKATALMKEKEE